MYSVIWLLGHEPVVFWKLVDSRAYPTELQKQSRFNITDK